MKLEHEFVVPLGADDTWDLLLDIEKVAGCFPGASLIDADGDSFAGTVAVRLGPVAMTYRGSARFVAKDSSSRVALIEAKGKETSGAGGAGADVRLSLTDSGPSTTTVTVETDLSLSGRPAQFGRGIIADVANNILQQFTRNLETRLLAPDGAATTGDGEVAATTAAESPDMAALVVRATYRRLGPWIAGAAGLGTLVLVWRRLGRAAR